MGTTIGLPTAVPSSDTEMSGNDKAVARPTLGGCPLCNTTAPKLQAALTFSRGDFQAAVVLSKPDNVELLRGIHSES
jgi:hypothetical protein